MAAEARFPAMGSQAHVIVCGDAGLVDVARARIEQLEARWSRFIPTSEISTLNARRGEDVPVSADTIRLVRRAVRGWRDTGGRFDPTVLGDMIRAGYDRTFEAVAIDARGGLSFLQRDAGGIAIDATASTVRLPSETGFDPGGVGKGLAADLVVEELLAAGASGACVNVGGDLRVEGEGPDGRWVVGVDDPRSAGSVATLALAAGGVATSTTSKRRWVVGGQPRNHLIDPLSGRSLDRRAIGATVLSRDAASAEIATKHALFAPEGLEIAALHDLGCDGMVVFDDGTTRTTAGWEAFLIEGTRPS